MNKNFIFCVDDTVLLDLNEVAMIYAPKTNYGDLTVTLKSGKYLSIPDSNKAEFIEKFKEHMNHE